MNKTNALMVFSCIVLVMLISFASANLFDSIKNAITGKATSQPTNLSIQVKGAAMANITYVSPIAAVTPNESSSVPVTFSVLVYDRDGWKDVNQTSVSANFSTTLSGNSPRFSGNPGSCTFVNNPDGKTANFTCTIRMWYWDAAGSWNVSVSATDLGNKTFVYNMSTQFTFNSLQALVISPGQINWDAVAPGQENQTAINDPTLINNTGNWNSTVAMTAISLLGDSDTSESIPANNFTLASTAGGSPPVECSGTKMVNATQTVVVGTIANRGNLSAGGGAGQSNLYYCINRIPEISSQGYSTLNGGSWTVAYA